MKNCIMQLDSTIIEIIHFYKNKSTEVSAERLMIHGLVQNVINQNKYHPSAKGINIRNNIDPKLVLMSDKYRVNIILNNLITNAIKYSDSSKNDSFIIIDLVRNVNQWELKIEDNGIGIPKEHQEKVFAMFYRASDLSSGSGLGLYITSESCNKLNFELSFKSKSSEGSIFSVKFSDNLIVKDNIERVKLVQN